MPTKTEPKQEPQQQSKPERPKKKLPSAPTKPRGILEEKTTLLFGPEGIGKSTLASEWGKPFFLATEPGLSELEVAWEPCPTWTDFLEWCKLMADDHGDYTTFVIDTVDVLAQRCREHTNRRLGIVHESDLDWGKGWDVARSEWHRALAKLSLVPGLGVLLIGHSQEVEIKTRSAVYTKQVPKLGKGPREIVTELADLVLFMDHDDQGGRVIRTKPDREWVAKERGREPRLPATISLAEGEPGYFAIRDAWYGGSK